MFVSLQLPSLRSTSELLQKSRPNLKTQLVREVKNKAIDSSYSLKLDKTGLKKTIRAWFPETGSYIDVISG